MIGADALSRWVDWDDRNSCILFGDGAGAMVLEAAEGDDGAGLLGECLETERRLLHGRSFNMLLCQTIFARDLTESRVSWF